MALAVRQTPTVVVTDNSATSVVSFSSLPLAGSLIVVASLDYDGSGTVTCADNQGNGAYTQAVVSNQNGGSSNRAVIFYKENIGAPSGTFTVTLTSAAGHYWASGIAEVTGAATVSPLDQTKPGNGNSNAPSTGNSSATTQADEIVFAVCGSNSGSSNVGFANPPATGYTQIFTLQDQSASQGGQFSYKIISSTGVQSASWATTAITDLWECGLATFKAAAAGLDVPRNIRALAAVNRAANF